MASYPWGRGGFARRAFGVGLLLVVLSACTPLFGGVALLGVVSLAALTSHCYDYLDVTVLDADGRKTCAATVTASNGGSQFELASCYYTPLSDGRWTLRASLPGSPDAVSTVEVDHAHDCTRHVLSVELTLNRAGSAPAARPVLSSPPAITLPPPATAPSASAPAAPVPSSVPAGSGGNSAQPPVGVFPDRSETSH